jgi:hypothetical protein
VYFQDASGDVIKTVVDWICPRGSQRYFLPVIAGLPGYWIGSARIESQDWLSPGNPAIRTPPILSVVMLEKYTDPAKVSRQEAVVYNALQEMGSFDWPMGPGQATGFSGSDVLAVPYVARHNRGVTTELAIQNLNPNPGFTDFVIYLRSWSGWVPEATAQKSIPTTDSRSLPASIQETRRRNSSPMPLYMLEKICGQLACGHPRKMLNG